MYILNFQNIEINLCTSSSFFFQKYYFKWRCQTNKFMCLDHILVKIILNCEEKRSKEKKYPYAHENCYDYYIKSTYECAGVCVMWKLSNPGVQVGDSLSWCFPFKFNGNKSSRENPWVVETARFHQQLNYLLLTFCSFSLDTNLIVLGKVSMKLNFLSGIPAQPLYSLS